MCDKRTPKKDAAPAGASRKTRDVSSSGDVGYKIVTVMCWGSKCVGNPNVICEM